MWKSNKVTKVAYEFGIGYRAPSNLSYNWSYGGVALIFLLIQILTGVLLAAIYTAGDFEGSLNVIMREVYEGWWLRLAHVHGAGMFFFVVYIHMLRGIVYSSYLYPRQHLWMSGVLVLLVMVFTALLGYILPWGQMSYWATIIILYLIDGFPGWKEEIFPFVMGGFSFSHEMLYRCFSLHYFFSFFLLGLVLVHLILLHETGSTNNTGGDGFIDSVSFGVYFLIKDLYVVFLVIGVYGYMVFSWSYATMYENMILANIMVTPRLIKPEWYFLPFYGMIKLVYNKNLGLLHLACAIGCLLGLGFLGRSELKGVYFDIIGKTYGMFLACNLVDLAVCSGETMSYPWSCNLMKSLIIYYLGFLVLYIVCSRSWSTIIIKILKSKIINNIPFFLEKLFKKTKIVLLNNFYVFSESVQWTLEDFREQLELDFAMFNDYLEKKKKK